jgi:hypothetical protein
MGQGKHAVAGILLGSILCLMSFAGCGSSSNGRSASQVKPGFVAAKIARRVSVSESPNCRSVGDSGSGRFNCLVVTKSGFQVRLLVEAESGDRRLMFVACRPVGQSTGRGCILPSADGINRVVTPRGAIIN